MNLVDFIFRSKEFLKSLFHNLLDRKIHNTQKKWMQNSNILFTQIKSGTTFLTNFFAAYNYLQFNFKGEFDLSKPEKYGAFRITRSNFKDIKNNIEDFNKRFNNSMQFLFVTHHRQNTPKNFYPETKIIMTSREKVDWLDSALDFKYTKRNKKLSRKKAINLLLKRYKNVDIDQKLIQKNHEASILLMYPYLMNDQELINTFQFLGINLNLDKVKKIKKMISKEKIKEVEKKLGHTLIAGKFLKDLSFISENQHNKSNLTTEEINYAKNYK